ncbi:MAG: hypothetical protein ACK4KW_13785 [Gemmobacter sp.]
MRRAGIPMALGAALGACAAPPQALPPAPDGVVAERRADGLAIRRLDGAFHYSDGLAARRAGQAVCAAEGRRLRHGIRDRFEAGAWIFPEGCA